MRNISKVFASLEFCDSELNEWFDLTAHEVAQFTNICKETEDIIECMLDNPFFNKNLNLSIYLNYKNRQRLRNVFRNINTLLYF